MDENTTDPAYDNFSDYCENCSGSEYCDPGYSHEVVVMAFQVTVSVIAFVFGVIGNTLVIATFTKYRRLRMRCMTDVFLFHLALSDLLLLLSLPLATTETIVGSWVFGNELCKLNYGLCAINTYGGLLLLACISIDRYLLVVRARTVQALRSRMLCYSKLSAVGVALASVVLSLPELWSTSVDEETQRCLNVGTSDDNGRVKMWARMLNITGFCVPCVTMLVCYSTIGHVLMQGRGKCFRRQKTLRLIVALIVAFLLFQLPYAIVLSIRMFLSNFTCKLWLDIHLAEDITRSLAYVRCCLNPLLYALVGIRFRGDVTKLLRDCGCLCPRLMQVVPKQSCESSMTPTSTVVPFSDIPSPVPKIENPADAQSDWVKESHPPTYFSSQLS